MTSTSRRSHLRYLPIAALALGFLAFVLLGGTDYLSFDTLKTHRHLMQSWVADHAVLSVVAYILVYVVVVAFSLPGGAVMTIFGGFLFGTWQGGLMVVIGATVGATLLFLAARTAFGDLLRRRAGPGLQRMEAGFRENAFGYLLVLRLIPLFPFFLVNLVPAFLGVSLGTYVLATFVGIMPGTFVFASVGNGLGAVFEQGGEPDTDFIHDPEVFGPLLALAALASLPVLYRCWRRRHGSEGS